MRCSQCKSKMLCLDTRTQPDGTVRRKVVCNTCDIQAYTIETWETDIAPRRRYVQVEDTQAEKVLKQLGVEKPEPKSKHSKRKEVVRKQREREATLSTFDDMDEDYTPDFTELGLDIPSTDDW